MLPDGVVRYQGEITVSSSIDGESITEIEPSKYCYQTKITKATIQEGFKKIGMEAFIYCIGLKSLVLPSTLKEISYAAFRCCSNLKNITFMGTHEQWSRLRIGKFNDSIKNASVECLGDIWEYEKISPTDIRLLFYKNGVLSGDVKIPSEYDGYRVRGIGNKCFSRNSKITSVIIPDEVVWVGDRAFEECSELTSVKLSKNLEYLGEGAFQNCISLTSVSKENSGNKSFNIMSYAFSGCSGLYSISLSNDLNSIYSYAFMNCSSLLGIDIPDNVQYIGNGVFLGCESIKSITVRSKNSTYRVENGSLISVVDGYKKICYCPNSFKGEYIIPDGVKEIAAYAFEGCKNLISVSIPDSVVKISSCAFSGCISLGYINLSNIKELGDKAFKDCVSLQNITLPKLDSLGYSVFDGCIGLSYVVIEEGVSKLTSGLFRECSGLQYMSLPASLKSIQEGALECSHSMKLEICFKGTYSHWESIKGSIGSNISVKISCIGDMEYSIIILDNSLDPSIEITKFKIPDFKGIVYIPSIIDGLPVVSIGECAFNECENITSVYFPETLVRIERRAFSFCSSMSKAILPESLEYLGECAFQRCKGLTTAHIPGSCKSIGQYSYRECSGLMSLVMDEGVEDVCTGAFWSCISLSSISIPSTMKRIYSSAFSGDPANVIYYNGTEEQYTDIQIDSDNSRLNTPSYVTFKS